VAERPTGTVTFLFTDIEASTRLWEQHPAEMRQALERHDEILRSVIEGRRGCVFSTAGDAFAAAFARVDEALSAAGEIQDLVLAETWPESTPISVRMGLHTGATQERDGDYFGSVLNRAARIMSAGHGGQVLVSAVTTSMADGVPLVDVGEHRLKDLSSPEHLFQLGSGQFPALRTLDRVLHNLPGLRAEVVGRAEELKEATDRIMSERLVTLTGPGGMGKTTLALSAAVQVADKFADGVWFTDLVPITEPGRVAGAVAQAAGLRLGPAQDLGSQLAELIGDRQLLLVIDNCEHLIDEVAEIVDAILERSSDAHVFATSRERLNLPGAQVIPVGPLDRDSAAVQLLVERAASLGVDLSVVEPSLLARVCDGLDGMPLAIELAAASLTHLRLEEFVDHVDSQLDLLEGAGRGRRARQASLRGVLAASWDLLDQPARDLLARLAVFPGSFHSAAVEVVAEDLSTPMRSLRRLVDSSLVDTGGPSDSPLRLLESIKQYAIEQWSGDGSEHRERHLGWVRDHLLEPSLEQLLVSGNQILNYSRHTEDFRAAGRHAV
jgi:predicted ATPase/class 3 adenylate cyclase